MPIHIQTDPSARLRLFTVEGDVDDEEILDVFPRLWRSPEYEPSFDELYDLSGLAGMKVTSKGLRELAEINLSLHKSTPGARVAVYAPTDVAYGMNRMYQVFVEDSASRLEVFRDLDEARRWLASARDDGGEPTPAPPRPLL